MRVSLIFPQNHHRRTPLLSVMAATSSSESEGTDSTRISDTSIPGDEYMSCSYLYLHNAEHCSQKLYNIGSVLGLGVQPRSSMQGESESDAASRLYAGVILGSIQLKSQVSGMAIRNSSRGEVSHNVFVVHHVMGESQHPRRKG